MLKPFKEWYEELKHDPHNFYLYKEDQPPIKAIIRGDNNIEIPYKKRIFLNYGSIKENDFVYIEDTLNKDLLALDSHIECNSYFTGTNLLLDFHTGVYYKLSDFDLSKRPYQYMKKHKKLTVALLNHNKDDIVKEWISNILFL